MASFKNNHKTRLVFIVDSTGTSKSRPDKMQVYQGLDVTTKKTPEPDLGMDFLNHALSSLEPFTESRSQPIVAAGLYYNYLESLLKDGNNLIGSRDGWCFALFDVSFPVLFDYVGKRVDEMVEVGLVDEFKETLFPGVDYSHGVTRARAYIADIIMNLSRELGNSYVGNPSALHDNGSESVGSSSTVHYMDIDSINMGLADMDIDDEADIIVNLSRELGNSYVGNPSALHDNGSESVGSSSTVYYMDIDSINMGLADMDIDNEADIIVNLSREFGNSYVGNPSALHDNGSESVGSSSTVHYMDIDFINMGLADIDIDDEADIIVNLSRELGNSYVGNPSALHDNGSESVGSSSTVHYMDIDSIHMGLADMDIDDEADIIVNLSRELGNSYVGNPSALHDNGSESVGSSSTVHYMDIDSIHMGLADMDIDDEELSGGEDGQNDPEGIIINLDRVFLGRMRIGEDIRSPEELTNAVMQFADLNSGGYVFHYRGEVGNVSINDYQNFEEFKDDVCEIDIHAVGVGEIVSVP